MEIGVIKLEIKLVSEFTENKGSANVKSTPYDHRKPKHGKVLNFYVIESNLVPRAFPFRGESKRG